jgi:hypothetical protein
MNATLDICGHIAADLAGYVAPWRSQDAPLHCIRHQIGQDIDAGCRMQISLLVQALILGELIQKKPRTQP